MKKKVVIPIVMSTLMVLVPLMAQAESSNLEGGFQVRASNTQDNTIEATAGLLLSPAEEEPGETDPGETDPGETDPGETDPPVPSEKSIDYSATVSIYGFNNEAGVPYKIITTGTDVNGDQLFDTYEGVSTGDNTPYRVELTNEEDEKVETAPTELPKITQVEFQFLSPDNAAIKQIPGKTTAAQLNETESSYSYDLGDYIINGASTDRPLTGDINPSGLFDITIQTLRWEVEPDVRYDVTLGAYNKSSTTRIDSKRTTFPVSESYFNTRNIDGFINVTNDQITWRSDEAFDHLNIDVLKSGTYDGAGLGLCKAKEHGTLKYKSGRFSMSFGVATLANVNSLDNTCNGYRDTYCTDNGYDKPNGSAWCTPGGKPIKDGLLK